MKDKKAVGRIVVQYDDGSGRVMWIKDQHKRKVVSVNCKMMWGLEP